ncbi:MAG: alpha/beta hydrolase [Polyangia bacterium]
MFDALFDKMIGLYEVRARHALRRAGFSERSIPTRIGALTALDGHGGGKTPLMLVHGFSAEAVHYAKLIELLRPHVGRIIVPELPAHGTSAAPPVGTTGAELRAGIIEFFDRLVDEPTVIFGNSMGGLAAIYYALARPEKVKGLMLASPAGAGMTEPELAQLLKQFQLKSYADALAFVDRLLVDKSRLRRLLAWGVSRKFAIPELQALLMTIGPQDLLKPSELEHLTVPTLLWWGKDDRILPRESFDFFAKHLPDTAIIEEPPRMSHSPYLEDPDGVASRIVEFVLSLEE